MILKEIFFFRKIFIVTEYAALNIYDGWSESSRKIVAISKSFDQ